MEGGGPISAPDASRARPTVSLILAVRNEAEHISACLEAIRQQTYPAELIEVIVMDGESSDATVQLVQNLASRDPRIRVISNHARTMSAGLNLGIREATGDFVGVVSGHSLLPDDYVARVVEASAATGAWSVGGRIARRAGTPTHRAIAIATSSPIGVGDSAHNYASKPGWMETVFPGFWRRELFDRIGLFDPEMVANEDNELSLRIRKAGGRIWYDPEIEIEYVPRATFAELFHQFRRYGLGKILVLRKHRGGLRWRHFVPAAVLAFMIIGGLASVVVRPVLLPWLLGIALYAATLVVAGLRLQQRGTTWCLVSAALATVHLAYGVGTWQGLVTWWSSAPRK